MALSNLHTDWQYGSYMADRDAAMKKLENDKLAGGNLAYLNAHVSGQRIDVGYGYDLFENFNNIKTDLKDYASDINKVYDLVYEYVNFVGPRQPNALDNLTTAINQYFDFGTETNASNFLAAIVTKEYETRVAMEGEVVKAKKRYDLERLRSPVDGTVHGLGLHTIGGVVTPAQPVVTIVPEGIPLIVEAMALNKDIGFLKTGQEAEIKFDTFPFQKYGVIKGNVAWISPDAFEDEKLGPVYKMKVEIERRYIKVDGKDVAIVPGMTATAEVKTSRRRIIEFFLSPIVKYATESLTLR